MHLLYELYRLYELYGLSVSFMNLIDFMNFQLTKGLRSYRPFSNKRKLFFRRSLRQAYLCDPWLLLEQMVPKVFGQKVE